MKIDTDAYGVFHVEVSLAEVNDWLTDPAADLPDVNSAIDEAASWAADNLLPSRVVIEIKTSRP